RRLDRVRIADEHELAVEVEPPVRGRQREVADLEARARLVARAFDEPGHRRLAVHDAARIVRMKAPAPVRIELDVARRGPGGTELRRDLAVALAARRAAGRSRGDVEIVDVAAQAREHA